MYISLDEMQNMIQRLANADLSWNVSRRADALRRITPREMTGEVQIKTFFSNGTDWTSFDPKKLCTTLAPLDSALKEPRALWEFQLFRVDYHCEVAGFDRNAYPEHYKENQ